MTVSTNQTWGFDAPEATNQSGANKTHTTFNVTKYWKLIWQTYQCEEQDGYPVPVETKETTFSLKPSQSHINQLRKQAHALGYKLVAVKEQVPSFNDEF